MAARAPKVHWLRENAQERTPHRILTFDTETDLAAIDQPERQILRLWSARLDRRHDCEPGKARQERYHGTTAVQLGELVNTISHADATTWIVAHNLGFDLAVTELPVILAGAGWHVTEGAMTTDAPWCRMARGSRRLLMTDTWSYLPTSNLELGKLVGTAKVPLPEPTDPAEAWQARCDADVEITADAFLAALDWWDANKLGNWSITGPATGWSSYRHRRPAPKVLIDPDPVARAFEALAVTGGRRECRHVGELPRGLYADLDMHTAHLSAMAGMALPHRRLGRFASLSIDSPLIGSGAAGVLAECTVQTSSPRYPWNSGRGIFYPVGTFRTTLAGPEIVEARSRGDLLAIGAGYPYLTSPHMADWAVWLASLIADDAVGVPPVVRVMAKHWSRAVPGKWGGHGSDVVAKVPDDRPGWSVERAYLMPGRQPADLLRIGGERWTIVRDLWADDAFPAILAWIQSATRVALGRLADMLGSSAVSMNTDGLLVDVAAMLGAQPDALEGDDGPTRSALLELARVCDSWDDVLAPFSVRVKSAAGTLRVVSPQHAIMGDDRRLSGIPRKAVRVGFGEYRFTQWPGLRVQLAPDRLPGYVTREATVNLSHVPVNGWRLDDGRVLPIRLAMDAAGSVSVVTHRPGHVGAPQLMAPEWQHPYLRPFLPAGYTGPSRAHGEPVQQAAWL